MFGLNVAALLLRARSRIVSLRRWAQRPQTRDVNEHALALRIEPLDPVTDRDKPDDATHAVIAEALGNLPPLVREVFLMSRVDRLSYAEIGRELGISLWRVRRVMGTAIAVLDDAVSSSRTDARFRS